MSAASAWVDVAEGGFGGALDGEAQKKLRELTEKTLPKLFEADPSRVVPLELPGGRFDAHAPYLVDFCKAFSRTFHVHRRAAARACEHGAGVRSR